MVTKIQRTATSGTYNKRKTGCTSALTCATTVLILLFSAASTALAAPELPEPTDATPSTDTPVITGTENPDKPVDSAGGPQMKGNRRFPQAHLNTIPEDENSMRLLEINVGKYQLVDLIVAYQKDDMIFLPLGYMSELIDIAIRTDPNSGIATGFVLREDRLFRLDAKRGEVTISGKLRRINKQQVALREFDDIYVDSNLLGELLPMKFDIDLYASRLKIISKEPLPLELRKKREERMQLVRSRAPIDRGYEKQEFPYQDWNYPLINQTARIGIQRDASEELNGTFGYTTYATADLLNMESAWYLTGTNEDLVEDVRGTFSKHDASSSLLGIARATEYAFGHINEPRLDLVTRPLDPQLGASISNYPLTRQLQYDSHNFRGDLPPGWEVELYRNNDLLGYINTSDNGQYQFDDVALLFGTNYFRLIFYGPQGQQREETFNFTLDRSLTEPGRHYYRALASRDEDFGHRLLAQYDFGLSKNISLNANFASVPLDKNLVLTQTEENHNYVTGGVRGFYQSLFYKSDLLLDMQSGSAIDWEIQSRLGGFIVNFGETYFQNDFVSEEFPELFVPLKRRTELKVDTAIPASFLPRIPVSFEIERKSYGGSTTVTRYGNRISMQQHGLSISNTLNRNQQTGTDDVTAGNLQVSRRAFGYNLRGSMSYQLSPETELSAISFVTDGIKLWGYHVNTGITHITRSDTNELLFNMTKSKGQYSLGLSSRYSTGGIIAIDLTFAIGLGYEPRSGKWKAEYRPIASQGSMSVQTFVDNDLDGIKDSNEKSVPGTKVQINGGNVNEVADEDGIIFITGVEPYREIDVGLAMETLDDPLWQPAVKGKRVTLRPGHTAQINFPIIITGEIDGTAYVQFDDEQREVSGVVIELIDLDGNIIKSSKTAYDGFYLMDKIPAGKYQLRVSREQTDSLNLLPVQSTFVVIEPQKPIVNGMDFVLQRRGQ